MAIDPNGDGASYANITVQLGEYVSPEILSVEHISEKMAVNFTSAPKDFRLWGVEAGPDRGGAKEVLLLSGSYKRHLDEKGHIVNSPIQSFKVHP